MNKINDVRGEISDPNLVLGPYNRAVHKKNRQTLSLKTSINQWCKGRIGQNSFYRDVRD